MQINCSGSFRYDMAWHLKNNDDVKRNTLHISVSYKTELSEAFTGAVAFHSHVKKLLHIFSGVTKPYLNKPLSIFKV